MLSIRRSIAVGMLSLGMAALSGAELRAQSLADLLGLDSFDQAEAATQNIGGVLNDVILDIAATQQAGTGQQVGTGQQPDAAQPKGAAGDAKTCNPPTFVHCPVVISCSKPVIACPPQTGIKLPGGAGGSPTVIINNNVLNINVTVNITNIFITTIIIRPATPVVC